MMNFENQERPLYRGGPNMAMKIPAAEFDATVRFYRDVVGLPLLDGYGPDTVFQYGASVLWLDCVRDLERAEVWLELLTPDLAAAAQHLDRAGVVRCDAVEPLPAGFDGFWIRSPASVVHLVTR